MADETVEAYIEVQAGYLASVETLFASCDFV